MIPEVFIGLPDGYGFKRGSMWWRYCDGLLCLVVFSVKPVVCTSIKSLRWWHRETFQPLSEMYVNKRKDRRRVVASIQIDDWRSEYRFVGTCCQHRTDAGLQDLDRSCRNPNWDRRIWHLDDLISRMRAWRFCWLLKKLQAQWYQQAVWQFNLRLSRPSGVKS